MIFKTATFPCKTISPNYWYTTNKECISIVNRLIKTIEAIREDLI